MAQETVLEKALGGIQELWDSRFAMHMTEKAKEQFPKELQQIKDLCISGRYDEALRIAHENCEWAGSRTEVAEVTGPGAAYFHLYRQFQSLEILIRRAA